MSDAATPLTPKDRRVAALLVLSVLTLGQFRLAPAVGGAYHDDGVYATTAKALAEGKGYRLVNLPGEPPQTKYPVLYPAALAVVWRLAPTPASALWLMQQSTLLCGAALAGLGYLYLVRFGYAGRGPALAGGLLCASAPGYLYFATSLLTEAPFGLLAVASLWALEVEVRRERAGRRGPVWLGVVLALPVLCRTAGAPLVPAALWVLWRRGRPVLGPALGAALVLAPWAAWCALGAGAWRRDPVEGYYTDYLGWWAEASGAGLLRVLRTNALLLVTGTGGLALDGPITLGQAGGVAGPVAVALLAAGLVAWLAVVRLAARGAPLGVALAAYAALLLVWPWPPMRFLVPLAPLLVALTLAGAARALERLRPATARAVAAGVTASLLALNLVALGGLARLTAKTGFPHGRLDEAPVAWSSYRDVFDWLRDHSEPDDTLACGLDSMVYLNTGRRAFRPFVHRPLVLFYDWPGEGVGPVEELSDTLRCRRPRYLVHVPLPGFAEERPFNEALRRLRAERPGLLREVYRGADARFVVYEIKVD